MICLSLVNTKSPFHLLVFQVPLLIYLYFSSTAIGDSSFFTIAKTCICTCLQKCKKGKEVSHSTYQWHKSDHDKDAMVSQAGAGITTAMEVEDSSDSDSLGFGDESGMEVDDIPGNYTENSGTLGMRHNYIMDEDMSHPDPSSGTAVNQGHDPMGSASGGALRGEQDIDDQFDLICGPDPGCQ
ncbi:hypothetical protein L208DRAFT_1375492 [Tricholoma matsutake]|nr:hypothetical protein L208DRAFT_1375492 [Tricholoma matsutake 945]